MKRQAWNKGQKSPELAARNWRHGLSPRGRVSPPYLMWQAAKQRSKKSGVSFELALSDIPAVPNVCPILGIQIFRTGGQKTENSPSLDRINPNLGYERGNVRIISLRANRLKGNANSDEATLILKDIITIEQKEVDELALS